MTEASAAASEERVSARRAATTAARFFGLAAVLSALPAAANDITTAAIGTNGAEFLTIDSGARGIAMGGAYTALTNDAYSLYWNPAGLTQIPRMSTAYTHDEYVAGITFDYASYAQRLSDTAVLGGAVRYMDGGSITQTDVNGNSPGSFHPRNYVYELGYGQYITDLADFERDISMGVTARYFQSDVIAHANGFGGDLGIQVHYYNTYFPYDVGAVFKNFGLGEKFDQTRDSLPFQARVGGAVHWTPYLLTSFEGVVPVANQPYGAFGLELAAIDHEDLKAFFRAGFESLSVTNGLDGFTGGNFGVGITVGAFTVDYAYAPLGLLGNTHNFSVAFNLPHKGSRKFRER